MFEHFEPLKRDKKQPIRLSFGDIHPQSGEEQRHYKFYEMSSSPHGIALIINNEEISKRKDRQGARIDEMNLIQTFRYLGYIVEVHRDRSASQIRDIFDEVSTRDHSNYDSFISCLLSRGEGRKFCGTDGKEVDITDLAEKFNWKNCKLLDNKPKMFFVQASRGCEEDIFVQASRWCEEDMEIGDEPQGYNPVFNEVDFFFGYAASPRNVAWHDPEYGSWYVTELCRALCTHATYADLLHMIQEVHNRVGTDYITHSGYKQVPQAVIQLCKNLYFF